MPKPKPNQILYAFWDYDFCPYVLGGRVRGFLSSGKVTVEGYDGMAFKPIAILPDESGKDALKLIKELRAKYVEEEKMLRNKYAKMTLALIGLGDEK